MSSRSKAPSVEGCAGGVSRSGNGGMRHLSYMAMVLMVAGFVLADYAAIHSTRFVSAAVRSELDAIFGGALSVQSVQLRGKDVLELEGIEMRTTPGGDVFLVAPRAEVRLAGRRAEEVVIRDARLAISERVRQEWRREAARWIDPRSISDRLPRLRLPRASAQVEVDGCEHEVAIEEATLQPVPGEGLWLRARVSGGPWGEWAMFGRAGFGRRLRISFTRPELPLGELRQLVGAWGGELWDRLSPEGTASLEAVMEGDWSGVRWEAQVRDVGFRFRDLGVRGLRGRVELGEGIEAWLATPRGVAATEAGGRLAVRLRVEELSEGAPWELRFDMEEFPLEEVARVLPEHVLGEWTRYEPRGWAEFSGVARGRIGMGEHMARVEVRFAETSIVVPTFGRLEGLEGVAEYHGDTLNIWRAQGGRPDGTRISASARVDGLEHGPPVVRAEFACRDLPFPRFVELARELFAVERHFLPAAGDEFGPQDGRVTLVWTQEGGQEVLRVRLEGNRAVYRRFPLLLEDIRGEIVLRAGRVEFQGIEAKLAGLRTPEGAAPAVRLRGHVRTSRPPATSEFWIEVRDLPVDERLMAQLPDPLGGEIGSLGLRGRGQVTINLGTREGNPAHTSFVVGLNLSEGSLDPGVAITDMTGTIFVDGVADERGVRMTGHLRCARATVGGHPVTNLVADLALGERRATFHNVRADMYGGLVRADAQVGLEGRTFRARVRGDGLRLEEFAAMRRRYSGRGLSGEADLVLEDFEGSLDDLASLRGEGRLTVQEGFVWGIPVFVRLLDLDVSRLLATGPRPMTGEVRFVIEQGRIGIRDMVLSDDAVAIYGEGSVGFDGQLSLILKTFPNYGFRLPGVDWVKTILNELRGQVYAWEARGPFDDPQLSWRLFPSLGGGQ